MAVTVKAGMGCELLHSCYIQIGAYRDRLGQIRELSASVADHHE